MRLARWTIALALLAGVNATCAAPSGAYPTKPIRLIVPYPPGGGNDIIGRAVAEKLTEKLGQQVVIDNRGGAATVIGAEIAARSPADGYTILLATVTTLAVNPNLLRKIPYDALRDFDPVSMLATQPYLLVVHPGIAAKSAQELIALVRAKPGTLNFASPGTGSNGHLAGELMKSMTGIDMVHVAYKGTGPALNDLLGGHVSLMFATMPSVHAHVQNRKLRGIAVSTARRSPAMPAVPTLAESGVPGYSMFSWNGLTVPRSTPAHVVSKLNAEVRVVLESPDLEKRLTALGFDPEPSTPQAFAKFVREELGRYAKLVKAAGLSAQ
jgi:tripartite-type tricarboxylate transporter receptor subunit TctC